MVPSLSSSTKGVFRSILVVAAACTLPGCVVGTSGLGLGLLLCCTISCLFLPSCRDDAYPGGSDDNSAGSGAVVGGSGGSDSAGSGGTGVGGDPGGGNQPRLEQACCVNGRWSTCVCPWIACNFTFGVIDCGNGTCAENAKCPGAADASTDTLVDGGGTDGSADSGS